MLDMGDSASSKAKFAEIKDSILNGATVVGDSTLDLQRFFDTGVDFRNPTPGLLPPFTGDVAMGFFPDPTFNGVVLLSGSDINIDFLPPDGIPDLLQEVSYEVLFTIDINPADGTPDFMQWFDSSFELFYILMILDDPDILPSEITMADFFSFLEEAFEDIGETLEGFNAFLNTDINPADGTPDILQ